MATRTHHESVATSFPLHQIRVVLLEAVHDRAIDMLSAQGYDVRSANPDDEQQWRDEIRNAHMIGIRSRSQLDDSFFDMAERLWAIGCFCIGTDQVDLHTAASRGIAVFNAPFSNTRSVAEKTIAEIIVLHRKLFDRSAALHRGQWSKSASGAHEIRGRTLGIIGYGRIGSQVSVLAEALGMRVIYYDSANVLPLGNAQRADSFTDVLSQADCITLHVPDTAATRTLIGASELQQMKPGAYLINNARGSVVDVEALAQSIRTGHLGGGAIDVFPKEPTGKTEDFSTPLAGLPNVILTPHVGGSTVEAQSNIAAEVSEKLIRYMNNGSTASAINVPRADLPALHPDHRRVLHFHKNLPGVLGHVHSTIAAHKMNIAASYLQSDAAHGYAILDVDAGTDRSQADAREKSLLDALRAVPETIRVRSIW